MKGKTREFAVSKECGKCFVIKPLSMFHQNLQNKDGKHCYCKKCRKDAHLEYNNSRREEIAAYNREYARRKKSMVLGIEFEKKKKAQSLVRVSIARSLIQARNNNDKREIALCESLLGRVT